MALAIALAWPGPGRAQQAEPATPIAPGSISPVEDGPPSAEAESGAIPAEAMPTARVVMGPLDVIRESIFGPADVAGWKPLSLGTFFSEGWDVPYANSPEGTMDAPKQNWIKSASGVFGRFATVDFYYTNHLYNVPGLFLASNQPFLPTHTYTTGNQYGGYATALIPLNQRLELLFGTLFIDDRKSSPAGPYVANWGDSEVAARFRMIESRDFSAVAVLGERIPTGKTVNGNDINYVTTGMEFWWNFAPRWVVRGSSSLNISTGRRSATSVYINQLAAGRYLTTEDARFLKRLVVHSTVSILSDISGRDGYITDVYALGGFRFSLDRADRFGVAAGFQAPVAGPHPYAWLPAFSITAKW